MCHTFSGSLLITPSLQPRIMDRRQRQCPVTMERDVRMRGLYKKAHSEIETHCFAPELPWLTAQGSQSGRLLWNMVSKRHSRVYTSRGSGSLWSRRNILMVRALECSLGKQNQLSICKAGKLLSATMVARPSRVLSARVRNLASNIYGGSKNDKMAVTQVLKMSKLSRR